MDTKNLLDALYCVNYKQLQLRPQQAHSGTSDWLYQEPNFMSWARNPSSAVLWLYGSPGMGKSVLTRSLVEDTLAKSQQVPLPGITVVAHFFCTYADAALNAEAKVLRSLLHQLVQAVPSVSATLVARLQIRTRRGLSYSLSPSSLLESIRRYPQDGCYGKCSGSFRCHRRAAKGIC